jgi:hypothetical protein
MKRKFVKKNEVRAEAPLFIDNIMGLTPHSTTVSKVNKANLKISRVNPYALHPQY